MRRRAAEAASSCPATSLGLLLIQAFLVATACASGDGGQLYSALRPCRPGKGGGVPAWGGAATVTISAAPSTGARLEGVSLQECTAEGVCQWMGAASSEALAAGGPVSMSTERGLARCWHLVVASEFRAGGFADLFRDRKVITEATLGLDSKRSCASPGGCTHRIGREESVTIQVTYHEPPNALPPLSDPDLRLLGANFSSYAVKEFPYGSWVAPLHGRCVEWALVAEHHNCSTGAHAGTWLAELEPGRHTVVVAFKGTDFARAEEVITDLKMALVPCVLGENGDIFGGRCARGFLEGYKSVRGSVMKSLATARRRINPAPELFITGHSLGGAMATLLLADLLSEPAALPFRPSQTVVMHYGSPMVGDAGFRNRLWDLEQAEESSALSLRDHVRVVSTDSHGTTDFITHYPKCVPSVCGTDPSLYHHVGRRSYISLAGKGPRPLPTPRDEGNRVPPKRLMASPGARCMVDLLAKGANWLHDERDNYLPMSLSHSEDARADIQKTCSGRNGPGWNGHCTGTSSVLVVVVVVGGLGIAVVASRSYTARNRRSQRASPRSWSEGSAVPIAKSKASSMSVEMTITDGQIRTPADGPVRTADGSNTDSVVVADQSRSLWVLKRRHSFSQQDM